MYHQFYGLRESPFRMTPDPGYLYTGEVHREALAHIAHSIEERRGFVLILGEVGTGKTTLVRHVLRQLGPDVKPVLVFNSDLGFEELLEAILRDLEVPLRSSPRVELVDALNDYLRKANAASQRVVLILDEAQHLSVPVLEDIQTLSSLETAEDKLLQIVLVGQPELGERLGHASLRQLRQRIGLRVVLTPLSPSDTVRYVRHRLAVAGCSRRVFTRPALRAVHRTSKGIPRLINVICDNSLVLGFGRNKTRIGGRIVRQVTQGWPPPRHVASAAHSGWRRGARRPRRTRLGLHPGRCAAVGLVALLATGLLVARPRSLDRTAAVDHPGAVLSVVPPGAEEPSQAASLEPRAPEVEVADTLRREPAATPVDRAGAQLGRPGAEGAGNSSVPPSSDVLTVPVAARSSARSVAVVTIQTADTLPWLLHSVYGRVNHTVVDVVQLANPGIDVGLLRSGRRLRFPPIEPSAMVHELAERRYVVHLLTTSDPTDRRIRKLSADLAASGRLVRLVPVRLWTGCGTCFRVWAGEFRSYDEAESFYRRMSPGDAT